MCGQLILGRHEAAPSAVEDIAYEVWAAEMDRGNFSLDAIQGVTDYLGVALFP